MDASGRTGMVAPPYPSTLARAPDDTPTALCRGSPTARIAWAGSLRRPQQYGGVRMTPHTNSKRTALAALVPSLAGHKILVVGDVILDEYLFGRAKRMSREAPIPVLEFERQDHIPGGAANPAMNVAALGSQAIQVGVIGEDADGEKLCHILQDRGVNPAGLIADA